MDEWTIALYENGLVKIRHHLQNASYHGEVVITVEFEFHGVDHVLTISNIFVKTAIQLIKDEFDEHFGTNGLRNNIFIIENTLTATVVEYEMSDYGEREHDDDKYDDIGDDDDDDDDNDKNNDNDDVNEDDDNNDNDDNINIIRRWVGHDNIDIIRRWVGQDYDEDEEESKEEEEEEEEDDDDDDDDENENEDEVNYRPDPQSRD